MGIELKVKFRILTIGGNKVMVVYKLRPKPENIHNKCRICLADRWTECLYECGNIHNNWYCYSVMQLTKLSLFTKSLILNDRNEQSFCSSRIR